MKVYLLHRDNEVIGVYDNLGNAFAHFKHEKTKGIIKERRFDTVKESPWEHFHEGGSKTNEWRTMTWQARYQYYRTFYVLDESGKTVYDNDKPVVSRKELVMDAEYCIREMPLLD